MSFRRTRVQIRIFLLDFCYALNYQNIPTRKMSFDVYIDLYFRYSGRTVFNNSTSTRANKLIFITKNHFCFSSCSFDDDNTQKTNFHYGIKVFSYRKKEKLLIIINLIYFSCGFYQFGVISLQHEPFLFLMKAVPQFRQYYDMGSISFVILSVYFFFFFK